MRPVFWGHSARNFEHQNCKNGEKKGRWIYDESETYPDDMIMFRNTHPPVWEGELADRIRDELDRRKGLARGRATSAYTHRFSGLAVCGECGRFMRVWRDGNYRGCMLFVG